MSMIMKNMAIVSLIIGIVICMLLIIWLENISPYIVKKSGGKLSNEQKNKLASYEINAGFIAGLCFAIAFVAFLAHLFTRPMTTITTSDFIVTKNLNAKTYNVTAGDNEFNVECHNVSIRDKDEVAYVLYEETGDASGLYLNLSRETAEKLGLISEARTGAYADSLKP